MGDVIIRIRRKGADFGYRDGKKLNNSAQGYGIVKRYVFWEVESVKQKKIKAHEAGAVEALLAGNAGLWSFSRLLFQVYTGEQPLAVFLTERLTEYEGGKDREKTARKVRNWLHDRNLPQNREEAFKICFALELDEEQAEEVLGMTVESGIHYRDPDELVYAYCLRKGIGYMQAVRMKERLCGPPFLKQISSEETMPEEGQTLNLTGYVRRKFRSVETEEELARFLESSAARFGRYHNTAYRKFCRMLDCLIRPETSESGMPQEHSYSIRKAVEEYLRMGIPYEKRSSGYTWVHREIKRHWPSAKSIYMMRTRKTDVDRKTLLLLYIATEGDHEMQAGEMKPVEEHHRRMDLMLSECGMPRLNGDKPFDYLVLQAVRGGEEDEFISLKMERMIRKMFSEDGMEEER